MSFSLLVKLKILKSSQSIELKFPRSSKIIEQGRKCLGKDLKGFLSSEIVHPGLTGCYQLTKKRLYRSIRSFFKMVFWWDISWIFFWLSQVNDLRVHNSTSSLKEVLARQEVTVKFNLRKMLVMLKWKRIKTLRIINDDRRWSLIIEPWVGRSESRNFCIVILFSRKCTKIDSL